LLTDKKQALATSLYRKVVNITNERMKSTFSNKSIFSLKHETLSMYLDEY